MSSFYGGKQGLSFKIVKAFNSINEMNSAFEGGYAYTDVGFGEYVIITPEKRTDKEYGQLYRRSYEGAEYCGMIAGPAGPASKIEFVHFDEAAESAITQTFEAENGDLIAGRQDTSAISYVYWNEQDENSSENTIKLGLQIPTPTISFDLVKTLNYYENASIVEGQGKGLFYFPYELSIPVGVPGDSISNLRIVNVDENSNIIGLPEETPKQAIVYDLEKKSRAGGEIPTVTTYYLANYKAINNIFMSSQGELTIDYADGTSQVLTQSVKFIDELIFENQELKVKYNTDETIESLGAVKIQGVGTIGTILTEHELTSDSTLTDMRDLLKTTDSLYEGGELKEEYIGKLIGVQITNENEELGNETYYFYYDKTAIDEPWQLTGTLSTSNTTPTDIISIVEAGADTSGDRYFLILEEIPDSDTVAEEG